MRDKDDESDIENLARLAWAELLTAVLPAAAIDRGWPVATPAFFERVLLDHVLGAPWETVIEPPSGENACALDLILALEIGERVRTGSACLLRMNRRSLALRVSRAGGPCATAHRADPEPQIDGLNAAVPRPAPTSRSRARKRHRVT